MGKMKSIFMMKQDIEGKGLWIHNGIIRRVKISIIGHFGGVISIGFEIETESGIYSNVMGEYSSTITGGIILQNIFNLFDFVEDDPIGLEKLNNVPCRYIVEDCGQCVGIGSFLKDRFMIFKNTHEDAMKYIEKNIKGWVK